MEHAFVICRGDTITVDCLPVDLGESVEEKMPTDKDTDRQEDGSGKKGSSLGRKT